jgi:hypothetical protein
VRADRPPTIQGRRLQLHFEVVTKERLVQASILAANGEIAIMERLIDGLVVHDKIQETELAD